MDRAQGISRPDAGLITHARVTPPSGDPDSTQLLYNTCTRVWSPRRRVRVDPDRKHKYDASISMPLQQPEFPWAVYLASSDHRFRLLVFDFDTSRFGADQARADSDRLAAHLDDLGVQFLRAHSGPTGGQHIWIRLGEDGADPAAVGELNRVLVQHYPTFDKSPLRNPDKGVVRPPGAPHRNGGRSVPHLAGAELQQALERVSRGTTPEVVNWLLARHPHVEPATPPEEHRRPRIIEDAAGPRLDRPRRPLPHRTAALLATVPSKGADRSALAYTILLSMARAGHTLDDARAAVATAPGLIRLREDAARGRDDTERQWSRALARAATFTADPGQAPREPIDDDLDTIEHALAATTAHWGRRGGASDERILHALTALARTARTRVLDIDCRRLGQTCALDASTVSRRLRLLAREGWVTLVTPSAGTRAARWTLNLPPDVGVEITSHATQGEPAPASGPGLTLLTHHAHDLWSPSRSGGLGAATARVHWFYRSGVDSLTGLSEKTGYGTEYIERALTRLHSAGLLTSEATGEQLLRTLETVAQTRGVAGINARRAARHLVDRELFTWWNEEHLWRAARGKKSGARRTTSTGMLALPISAPARVRYGRFPTRSNGRADYPTARAVVSQINSAVRAAA
ncbi:FUSC family protein (plasmid) [Rhodococcus opacus]|nr:FUSC family protein [Rhodococcus opacus]UNN05273.1 FUSC family protein [Rhodococcus opacus]